MFDAWTSPFARRVPALALVFAVLVQLLGTVHVLVDVDGAHDEEADVDDDEDGDGPEEVGQLGSTVCQGRENASLIVEKMLRIRTVNEHLPIRFVLWLS